MKREMCALLSLPFMVAAIPLQLMGLASLADTALAISLIALWKSGYRLHIEDEE
jgi:hypothetical protein